MLQVAFFRPNFYCNTPMVSELDSPDGKNDHQLTQLENIIEYELLLFCRQRSIVRNYGDQLTDDLEEAIVEHECRHSLHCFKQLHVKNRIVLRLHAIYIQIETYVTSTS